MVLCLVSAGLKKTPIFRGFFNVSKTLNTHVDIHASVPDHKLLHASKKSSYHNPFELLVLQSCYHNGSKC